MKKAIKNKLYNTDTATMLGSWSNNKPQSDSTYAEESLFRKKTGEFFIYGAGGPMSRYGHYCGDGWGYGEDIFPLSYNQAKEWAEKKLTAEEYESIFGEVSEDGGKSTLTLSVSTSIAEKTRRAASKKGMGLSAYVESVLENSLKNE